jgi:hypothetical protein
MLELHSDCVCLLGHLTPLSQPAVNSLTKHMIHLFCLRTLLRLAHSAEWVERRLRSGKSDRYECFGVMFCPSSSWIVTRRRKGASFFHNIYTYLPNCTLSRQVTNDYSEGNKKLKCDKYNGMSQHWRGLNKEDFEKYSSWPSPRKRDFEKLLVSLTASRDAPSCMTTDGWLQSLREPATCLCSEPHASSLSVRLVLFNLFLVPDLTIAWISRQLSFYETSVADLRAALRLEGQNVCLPGASLKTCPPL